MISLITMDGKATPAHGSSSCSLMSGLPKNVLPAYEVHHSRKKMLVTPGRPLIAPEAIGDPFFTQRLVALWQRPDVNHPGLGVSLAEGRPLVPQERMGEALLAAWRKAELVRADPDHTLHIGPLEVGTTYVFYCQTNPSITATCANIHQDSDAASRVQSVTGVFIFKYRKELEVSSNPCLWAHCLSFGAVYDYLTISRARDWPGPYTGSSGKQEKGFDSPS
jgi:hypothetical protein